MPQLGSNAPNLGGNAPHLGLNTCVIILLHFYKLLGNIENYLIELKHITLCFKCGVRHLYSIVYYLNISGVSCDQKVF